MKPVDPRLLRHARATRFFLLVSVVLGLAGAGLVIAQAMLLADVIVRAFQGGAAATELYPTLAALAAVALGRAAVVWLTELAAHRASASVKSQLRLRLLAHAAALGPSAATRQRTGELTALATRGIDALDDYFGRYLPQLGLAATVPVAVLARIVTDDWISALTIVVTLPLIPIFMVLIGWATESRVNRQWRMLSRLSHHFLDVVAGLPTLRVFGRAKAQAESIRAVTGEYRRATMRTLRVAFLSSFALELLATISVALVAVGIGTRLVYGQLDLYTGLVVLILAPEAYLPLRQVGARYHAAAEGLAAADRVFEVLETPPPADGSRPAPTGRGFAVTDLVVRHPGRTADSLPATTLRVAPGETVALTGPSGAGKSTLVNAVLGFAEPAEGRVLVGDTDLRDINRADWHRQIAWVPQHPALLAGTVADNVRLARPEATDAEVAAALRNAAADDLDPALTLGDGGAGLSAGQRQRVALARAFLADRPVLLLDEPTAALDGATETAVVDAVRRLTEGRTVLLVVHRPALLALADRTVALPPPARPVPSAGAAQAPAESHDGRADTLADTLAPAPERPAAPGPADAVAPERPDADDTLVADDASEALAARTAPHTGAAATGGHLRRVREAGLRRRGRLLLAGTLGVLALASAVGLMAVSGWLISRASEQPPILYLMVAVTATRAFGIGRAVFRYAERLVSHDAVLRILEDVRVRVFRRLERLAPAGLRHRRRGDLLSRLVSDVDAYQDYFLRWLLPAAAAGAVSLLAVGFTGWLLPEAGLALAAGLAVAGLAVPLLTSLVARRTERELAPQRGALTTHTVDLLTGTGELTVAGALPAVTDRVRRADARLTGIAGRSAAVVALAGALTALAAGLTVTAAAFLGAQAVHAGRLEGVWLAVVVLTPLAAFEAVTDLPQAVRHRQRVRRAAARVHEVLDAPEPVAEPAVPADPPASPFPLVLDKLTVRHPGAARPALLDLDLILTEGRRVAVVGRSGAGKTSLAHALLRFLDAESGDHLLGGVPASTLDSDAVRRHVGLCAQDAHLFDSTLRENLRLALPDPAGATDDTLRQALARARLLTWVDSLPQGLDTPVGEHGARLSGGQRQRLSLARALLADFPVLVLDEPAEHLDLATADALTADLLAATEGRATVLITHRLAGLEAVDEILVLDAGRVVQRGGYAELTLTDGPFRAMLETERAADVLLTA
ncbi:thiol reductant ABC exporter subunit CydD [Streptomyces durbertensis]|uniref:Thiol reductant ABC exporter subunit CydD n=1 Tax=Streptomyces durbertensis TaxID=2448886 RepID=A0ABR6EKD4_9ACTN|nr:thiol reductant ABC exporter subunit CydD [Streptomyces durbertensis]MBB1245797.1 thiol reductant ABC exporter subunit CydD [Streptomyces durbertensis]